jgi:hypothetical protein
MLHRGEPIDKPFEILRESHDQRNCIIIYTSQGEGVVIKNRLSRKPSTSEEINRIIKL